MSPKINLIEVLIKQKLNTGYICNICFIGYLLSLPGLPHLVCIPYLTLLCQQNPVQYKEVLLEMWKGVTEDLGVPACGKAVFSCALENLNVFHL